MGGTTREMNERSLVETGKMLEDDMSFLSSLSLSKKFHVLWRESDP
jgi:hypothetical protein